MIFAANFKMHHTRASTRAYIAQLEQRVSEDTRVYIFPPATALDSYETRFTLGAQNAYGAKQGAFTGEIGLAQLEEFGISTVMVGHSERRDIFGESQAMSAQKFAFYKEHGFEIVYCIGEPLEVRERGIEAVMAHLDAQFEGVDTDYDKLIVAYEPVWAIGTGVAATPEAIAQTHAELRKRTSAPLLYGGSVKPENIAEISAIKDVDGVLVGSASLDAETFAALIKNAR